MKKIDQQMAEKAVTVSPEFLGVKGVSQYLGIQPSTLYCLVEQQKIPHYRIGRLIRFRRAEIDLWMEGNKKDCAALERVAKKTLGRVQMSKIDIDRVVRKAIDGVRGQGYTKPHGKPDRYEGPRKGGL